MTEEWKAIPSLPDYEASSLGRIRRATKGKGTWPGRVISPHIRPDGYSAITIQRRLRYVHRLVCEAFHGLPVDGSATAHGDGDRANNRAANLRWATYAENEADKLEHGTRAMGSRSGMAKLDETKVLIIRSAYRLKLGTQSDLSKMFGVRQTKISDIVNRKTWRHVE